MPSTAKADGVAKSGLSGAAKGAIFAGAALLAPIVVIATRQGGASASSKSAASAPAKAPNPSATLSPPPLAPFTNSIGINLVPIPSGAFLMGSKEKQNEQPVHRVTFAKGFHLGQTEVTQGQWEAVMRSRPWAEKSGVLSGPNYPAVYVTWEDARSFCRALSEKEGRTYRLPSEAEWEYAARAGATGNWCFGDDEGRLGDYAWFKKNASDLGRRYAQWVGTKKANAWGLSDMHGNVAEWCEDVYHDTYTGAPVAGEAWVSGGKMTFRVRRGGNFSVGAFALRSAIRFDCDRGYCYDALGFRVVLVANP